MSNFYKVASSSQLPPIAQVNLGDMGYTLDDGGFWVVEQPSAPPGAPPVWSFIDVLRGSPGPQGETGYGVPGPQGQIGPPGLMGGRGPAGPAGKSSFSNVSQHFQIPCPGDPPLTIQVSDTSWMAPGMLIYIPGAGTFTVVGNPIDQHNVQIVNSGDPNNTPCGTVLGAGATVSPANMQGPMGPQGIMGPSGPPGPQGVAGVSVYSILTQPLTIPPAGQTVVAFVQNASPFSQGQIVYVQGGDYFSVSGVNPTNNTLDLVNQSYPGGSAPGTAIPVGNNVSATGPQGPQGVQGIQGIPGPQGLMGVAPTGAILMWPTWTAPGGYLLCLGQSLPISQYPNLFAVISTQFGGDGVSTFNLPNFITRFPLGSDNSSYPLAAMGGEVNHTLTEAELAYHVHGMDHCHNMDHYHNINFGQINHAHGVSDPQHLHTARPLYAMGSVGYASGGGGVSNTPGINNALTGVSIQTAGFGVGNSEWASQTNAAWANTLYASQTNGAWANTQGAGSNGAHNNMPPYLVVNFIIKT